MKWRIRLAGTCVIGAITSSGAGLGSTIALAQSAPATTGALAQAEPVPYWWFHGTVEAGGRFFLNNPQRNGSAYLGQSSLAKYYEYSTNKPGAFSNIELATGSKDGLYQIDFGGKNIGYTDQNYYFDASKAGQHYLSLGWDETPHLYSTSAKTFFSGVGTSTLTPTCGKNLVVGSFATGTANAAAIAPCLSQTDIGIRRDTASVDYRWTPVDAWDIKANFSRLTRKGTQVDGVVDLGTTGSSGNAIQVPKPVDDATLNFGLNGEYAGTSPWGQKITYKLGYNGSQYTDNYSSYTVATPFTTGFPIAQMSTWPSNKANGFNETIAADLPWKSRYVGTASYTMMTQDAAFNPMTANPGAAPYTLPAASLDGGINTLMSNHVVTTKITPELTSKLSYRYYNFKNNTPSLHFSNWIIGDGTALQATALNSLVISYVKQNAGEELNWRPSREWNLGAAYGYERYSYNGADADVTYENSGRVYADWKPANWFGIRSSGYYSNRRYQTYDYLNFVGNNLTSAANNRYSAAYRQMMLDNRQTWKAKFSVDIVVLRGLTVTPNTRYQDDNYSVNPANQLGLQDNRSWDGGVDITYSIDRNASVMVGYQREYRTQLIYAAATAAATAATNLTNDRSVVNTFTAMAKYAAIPDKLDLDLQYTLSRGVDNQRLNLFTGATPANGQFPDNTTWFQRLDASAIYKFDPTVVEQSGLKGQLKAKLRYVWERNSVANWQNDPLAPYGNVGLPNLLFLAGDNPNYNVHVVSASLAYTW